MIWLVACVLLRRVDGLYPVSRVEQVAGESLFCPELLIPI